MPKSHLNINKSFMIGNGILAFAVIIVVITFIYMSFRLSRQQNIEKHFTETYNIELVQGFTGQSFTIYINDSILYNSIIEKDSIKLEIKRFAEQNALLIVNNETDVLSTFDLSEKGGNILLYKEKDIIFQKGN